MRRKECSSFPFFVLSKTRAHPFRVDRNCQLSRSRGQGSYVLYSDMVISDGAGDGDDSNDSSDSIEKDKVRLR